jgi:hypothetical protein
VPAEVVSAKTPDSDAREPSCGAFKLPRDSLQLVNVDLFGEGLRPAGASKS